MKEETSAFNKVQLTIISIILITVICNVGKYKEWFFGRTLKNWNTSVGTFGTDIEEIKLQYWGRSYGMAKILKENFDTIDFDTPIILFEPNSFYKKTNTDFRVPEPITFYYFTRMKSVWINSNNVYEATHFVTFNNNQMLLQEVKDSNSIKAFINHYKGYKPSL